MEKKRKAGIFVVFTPPKMVSFSTNFYSVCDTCDSKKTTSLLEGARTNAYARERNVVVLL